MACSFLLALWLYIDTYQNGSYHHLRIVLTIIASSLLAAYGFSSWQKHPVKRIGYIAAGTMLFAIADTIVLLLVTVMRPDVSIH